MDQKKQIYQKPSVEKICFSTDDVLFASGTGGNEGGSGDDNQGEWDPQPKKSKKTLTDLW